MMNSVKLSGACSLLVIVSLSSFADDGWSQREAHMQCGPALVQINAECKSDPRDTTVNICRSYLLSIKNNNKIKTLHLPYMQDSQKKLLESEGYTFNNIVEAGDWAPKTMSCYDNEDIVIGYAMGLSEEETVKGSLVSYIDAPFFDLDGSFILSEKLLKLRAREIKDPYNNVNVDFIESDGE